MCAYSVLKSVLLYGSETWRTTGRNTKRLQSFINKCLLCILGIKWYDKVTNERLWVKTGQAKNRRLDHENKIEMDRSHTEKTSRYYNQTGSVLVMVPQGTKK
jgi:hypothetical protein